MPHSSSDTPAPRSPGSVPEAGFDALVAEAEAAPVDGWDFSWFEGRATEERPSWGYQRLLAGRLADPAVRAALDLQTGGGEVLAGAGPYPPAMAATESWPPNLARATRLLQPRGVVVVAGPEEPPLPFADGAFDLVTSRHPATVWWPEIARVLAPGGTYFAQHVGPETVFELSEFFLGPLGGEVRRLRHPEAERAQAEQAGLEMTDQRTERLRMEFHDIGAVVHFLCKVVWTVPGFTVEAYRDKLRELHGRITAEGPFVAHSTRTLVEARRPA
ncbi:class I SAM-dependent methyltransferase [Streptomyces albidoflavus]|uniref:class I SAM-dependent methyltransferase n=1 Tax=Streptomyces albidoflavus TaxID=1886 RepID=UPI001C47B873|nr:class I SAM-dependent methyltransferase [Streptomyces albidoflavus]MBV7650870.1 class I SAM-dependent methyltransferase [Streptomyces albidoflavus]MBV7712335.1 class I SAM-dependent methyltransferase [Streptomyces albidoflavus]